MGQPEKTNLEEARGWKGRFFYVSLILGVTFAFQGSRGIWEPDEGRYVNAVVEMLAHGGWLVPKLHGLAYLDKSAAVYWAIASGVEVFGLNEWGVRFAHGLALVATALLVGAWVRPTLGSRGGRIAAAAYATALFPVVAANAITPDALLALWTTAGFVAYWYYRSAQQLRARYGWALALGLALALGIFTKGTAALIFAAPIVLHLAWELGPWRMLRRLELWLVAALALGLGCLWYLAVGRQIPGALEYFFDNQVAGRLWKTTYQRNSEWWKPLKIYGIAVVLGSLPWSLLWFRLALERRSSRWRELLAGDTLSRFLLLASCLPLVVLSIAKSRLELYALPVLAPIVALTVVTVWRSGMTVRWRRWLLLSALALIGLKATAAALPTERDSRRLAGELTALGVGSDACIDVLDDKAHGLAFYGFRNVSWHTTAPETYPYFEAPSLLVDDLGSLAQSCPGGLFILSRAQHLEIAAQDLAARDWSCARQRVNDRFDLAHCRPARDSAGLTRGTPVGDSPAGSATQRR